MISFRNVLITNIILTLILATCGAILFSTVLKSYYQDIYPYLLLLALSINLITFWLALKKNRVNQSFLLLVLSFTIKFFSYLLISIIYFINQEVMLYRVAYIFVLFILFLAYTSLELKMLSKFFKSNAGI
jgi:hypothetical protein